MQTLNKTKEELKSVIDKNKIEYTLLASWTGIDYDVLWRQFNTAKHFREDVRAAVKDALTKHGFITSSIEQIERLKDDLINSGAIINGAISMLDRSFQQKIKNRIFSETEKKDFKQEAKALQNKINDAFDSIILTVEMK
jgi:hypothetical protein